MQAIQTINRGKQDRIVQVVAVYQNNFYKLEFKVGSSPAELTESIKITNSDINKWIQDERLRSMCVFGPRSAKCYTILFGRNDLVLTNLTDVYHHMCKKTE